MVKEGHAQTCHLLVGVGLSDLVEEGVLLLFSVGLASKVLVLRELYHAWHVACQECSLEGLLGGVEIKDGFLEG